MADPQMALMGLLEAVVDLSRATSHGARRRAVADARTWLDLLDRKVARGIESGEPVAVNLETATAHLAHHIRGTSED